MRRWGLAVGLLLPLAAVAVVAVAWSSADGSDPRSAQASVSPSPAVTPDRATPTPSATPTSPRPPATMGYAPGSAQALLNAARPGATVRLPAGQYRETLTITKPVTLLGSGAEIRGSDLFTGWRASGAIWISTATVPVFDGGGSCSQSGCTRAEQVVFDGLELRRVDGPPPPGTFAIDAQRHVVLGVDPAGHLVEVTTRDVWIDVRASDVTIDGLVLRDAAPAAQRGGIEVDGVDRFTLIGGSLNGAHGADLSIRGGIGHRVVGAELASAGQLGLRIEDAADVHVEKVRIHDNASAGYDPGWEAGGLKALTVNRLEVIDSEVDHNAGQGIWCDAGCRQMTVSRNRVHDNGRIGIFFEISDGATIDGNRVWSNGWDHPVWVWGSGIVVSSASHAAVTSNIVAWNADGIAVVSQRRGEPWNNITGVRVEDNVIAIARSSVLPGIQPALLAWYSESSPTSMFSAVAGNGSGANSLWSLPVEPITCLFQWNGCRDTLAAYAAAGADAGTHYLSTEQLTGALRSAGVPVVP